LLQVYPALVEEYFVHRSVTNIIAFENSLLVHTFIQLKKSGASLCSACQVGVIIF